VCIHTILLGEVADKNIFSALATQTGGLFVFCSAEGEMVKTFSELERLINGSKKVYRIRFKYKPATGTVQSGTNYIHTVEISDPFLKELYNPVYVNVKVP